jgi:hypothetical protein
LQTRADPMPLSTTINQNIRATILVTKFISPNYKCDVGRYDGMNKLEIHILYT